MKLIFKGVVQGVGFRPTLYRIAKEMGLKGYVLNKGSEVEVVINKDVDAFLDLVAQRLPPIARITDIGRQPDSRTFHDFQILHSKNGKRQSLLPPDIALCNDCHNELFDTTNRRYHFPFTNCTVCGARYSLIEDVPYDRERTAMSDFPLCPTCSAEYTDVSNRRYHAQTISCPACGPRYTLYNTKKQQVSTKDPVKQFAHYIDNGNIGVIKSWGGMHLCCIPDEITRFRTWYKRPQKSFAVMVRDIATAKEYGVINNKEQRLLLSNKRPIVLVEKKKAELLSPGLNTIGLFLPYTGLYHLLFSCLDADAVIMTSANIPGEPMMINNDEVFSLAADYYLLHNRRIPNRVDDTVVRLWKDNTFFLRKSRGFVPQPLSVPYKSTILSVGADENITGALSVARKLYSTQYIGNAHYYATILFLEQSLRHLMKLFMKQPHLDAIAMDLHPGYDSRKVAQLFAKKFSIPLFEVQHDWAHAASLLVDHHIKESIVIVMEGLGYGLDKTFWGGDVLLADTQSFDRIGHLEYLPLLGGDQATRDPRRLVFAIFKGDEAHRFFSQEEVPILHKLKDGAPLSCSLGRYLDALSAYLDICTTRTYSGEPAMKLEKYLAAGSPTYELHATVQNNVISVHDLFFQLDEILTFPLSEKEKANAAVSFVKTVVDHLTDLAMQSAEKNNISTIGLSGGVSYNVPITNMVEQKVKKSNFTLIVHNEVPNGDGGVAIGQNAIAASQLSL